MSYSRRTNDRRRRTLYSAHQADQFPATAATRREAERLREARRPTAAYGSRVQRRLQGRWFSLVPVRRRTMITVAGILGAFALLLCGAHYASVAWPAIAYRPEIARPLRLDRADSFGRWFMVAMLTGSAGASLMIYQLRRYRIDDYQGHYRLWRLVLIVMILASVNSLVSIIDWGGALLDAGFGKRVALTGGDWIRLVVSLGGAVLALRLVAEVRRSRFALGMMILTCLLLAIPEAAKWKFLQVESLAKWAAVTSAPTLACTALLVSLGGYLRMLYREVQQIEDGDSLRERFQQMRVRVFQRSDDEEDDDSLEEPVKPRQEKRRQGSQPTAQRTAQEREQKKEVKDEGDSKTAGPAKRRWLGLGKAKAPQQKTDTEKKSKEDSRAEKPRKKRPFSMRLAPPEADQAKTKAERKTAEVSEEPGSGAKKRRGGLGGWLRRGKQSDEESKEPESTTKSAPTPPRAQSPASSVQRSEKVNPDEIDWDSLSKAERRRLRKQLKRQNRAA